MAKINGIENMTGLELTTELANGARFVVYEYAISLLVITFYRSSNVTFIKSDQNAVAKGFRYSLLTFFLGWWGIPWGPIRSVQALVTNFKGGKDVTDRVVTAMKQGAQKTQA